MNDIKDIKDIKEIEAGKKPEKKIDGTPWKFGEKIPEGYRVLYDTRRGKIYSKIKEKVR